MDAAFVTLDGTEISVYISSASADHLRLALTPGQRMTISKSRLPTVLAIGPAHDYGQELGQAQEQFPLRSLYLGSLFFQLIRDTACGHPLYQLCIAASDTVPLKDVIGPIGRVADADSLCAFLDMTESHQMTIEGTWKYVSSEFDTFSASLRAESSPWAPVSKELQVDFQPFPFDFIYPSSNLHYWLMSFMPEAMHGIVRVMDRSATPPFPWGHHFYAQLILEHCSSLKGDFAEFGVGLGGMSIFIARLAQLMGKRMLCVDSFEGLPPPRKDVDNDYFLTGDYAPESGVDLASNLKDWAAQEGVLNSMVIIKSFFRDLHAIPMQQLCFVHLDSDLYDSVRRSLELVYDLVVPGGIIIVDDYFHPSQGPARAVSDFFRWHGASQPLLHPILPYAVAVQKGKDATDSKTHNWKRAIDGNYYNFAWMRESETLSIVAHASRKRLLLKLQLLDDNDVLKPSLRHCLGNVERLLRFLRCSTGDEFSNRGCEVYEYLSCLESWFDTVSGSALASGLIRGPSIISAPSAQNRSL